MYDYFEKRSLESGGNELLSGRNSDELFSQLLGRGDPLVDLALATFTGHTKTLNELWGRGDRDLRLAIAANRQRHDLSGLTETAISEMAESDDEGPRRLVFRNPTVSLDTVKAVFDREGVFAHLADEAWLNVVSEAVWAPCLRSRIEVDRSRLPYLESDSNLKPNERSVVSAA